MKPLLLKPIPDYTIWGGDLISSTRGYDKNYGTWWEVSAHPYCTNEVVGTDKTLQQLIDEDKEGMLGPGLGQFEILRLAFLDAKDRLSVQVHPDDAHKPADDFGKYESWYVVAAEPGAKLAAGTKTSDADEIRKALEDGTLEELIAYQPVKAGDFIYIPAGLLHALGAGITALEVGTNSNTTYRFYDYGRKDAKGNLRPLHLKESFETADFSKKPVFVPADAKDHILTDNDHFSVVQKTADKPLTLETGDTYFILSNMSEDTELEWNGETIPFAKWASVFVPYSAGKVTLKKGTVLESRPKK